MASALETGPRIDRMLLATLALPHWHPRAADGTIAVMNTRFTVVEWAAIPEADRCTIDGDEVIPTGLTIAATPGHTRAPRIDC